MNGNGARVQAGGGEMSVTGEVEAVDAQGVGAEAADVQAAGGRVSEGVGAGWRVREEESVSTSECARGGLRVSDRARVRARAVAEQGAAEQGAAEQRSLGQTVVEHLGLEETEIKQSELEETVIEHLGLEEAANKHRVAETSSLGQRAKEANPVTHSSVTQAPAEQSTIAAGARSALSPAPSAAASALPPDETLSEARESSELNDDAVGASTLEAPGFRKSRAPFPLSLLVLFAALGAVYLIYTWGWVTVAQIYQAQNRALSAQSGIIGGVLQTMMFWLVPFAPALWYLSALWFSWSATGADRQEQASGKQKKSLAAKPLWLAFVLLLGLLLLFPLPLFVQGVAS